MAISINTTAINCSYEVVIGKPVFIEYDLYTVMRPLLMRPAPPNVGEGIYQYTHPGEYLTGQPQTTDTVARVADNGLESEYKPYGYGALTSDAMLNMNLTTPAGVDESPVSRSIRSLTKSAAEGAYYIQGPGSKYLRESLSAADRGEEEYTREPMTNESTWPTLPEVVYDFSNLEGIGEVRGWMTKTELVQLEVAHPTLPTQYWGTAKERKEQVALYAEFSSLFRTELTREPADITPMRINIHADGWKNAKGNALPARPKEPSSMKTSTFSRFYFPARKVSYPTVDGDFFPFLSFFLPETNRSPRIFSRFYFPARKVSYPTVDGDLFFRFYQFFSRKPSGLQDFFHGFISRLGRYHILP